MTGKVVGHHPRIAVRFRLNSGAVIEVEHVIDTGFEGALTLQEDAVLAMGLPLEHQIPATLADGSHILVDVYRAKIDWHNRIVEVAVLAMGERPLLGSALLESSFLSIRYEEGGEVQIDEF